MLADEIDPVLRETLADFTVSRSERRQLKELVAGRGDDHDTLAFFRHRAFAVAREAIGAGAAPGDVIEWLEGAMKALVPSPPSNAARDEIHEVCFSPGDTCRRTIRRLLLDARKHVDICVFTITDDELTDAVLEAHRRGVQVRVITDNDKANDLGSDIARIAKAGVAVRMDRTEHHMHHKFAVFDGHTVVTGSYNWTRSAAAHNRENVAVTNDPELVRAYVDGFDGLWQTFED